MRTLRALPCRFHATPQKRPLLVRGAVPSFKESPISPDELAGIACDREAPSRIILEHRGNAEKPWELVSSASWFETNGTQEHRKSHHRNDIERVVSGVSAPQKRGPFAEADFAKLTEDNWTLVVNGVDRVVPEARGGNGRIERVAFFTLLHGVAPSL